MIRSDCIASFKPILKPTYLYSLPGSVDRKALRLFLFLNTAIGGIIDGGIVLSDI